MERQMLDIAMKRNVQPFPTEHERWDAVQRRDPPADGMFYYSVATTGVYCRPTCGARLPRRENPAFHATCADAERAGFRPCKRCRPKAPSLGELAQVGGRSPYHFHRVFRGVTGVGPKAYAAATRARRVRTSLPQSG